MPPDVEVAFGDLSNLLGQLEHLANVGAAVGLADLAPAQAADLAVGLVGAEAPVDLAQVFEGVIQCCRRNPGIAHIDAYCRAHDLLDAPQAYGTAISRSEEHTSELQSRQYLVCR